MICKFFLNFKMLRQEESIPLLNEMPPWSKEEVCNATPQRAIGTAIACFLHLKTIPPFHFKSIPPSCRVKTNSGYSTTYAASGFLLFLLKCQVFLNQLLIYKTKTFWAGT